jgi:hypothetical protein
MRYEGHNKVYLFEAHLYLRLQNGEMMDSGPSNCLRLRKGQEVSAPLAR